jgi:hypothetical protein
MKRKGIKVLNSALSIVLALAGVLFVGAAPANAAPSYYPSGPQQNVAVSTVTGGGWTQCYIDTYNTAGTTLESGITSNCTGDYLLLAARPTNGATITLLAAAPRADVLFATSGNNAHNANGTDWYFRTAFSMGFTNPNTGLNLNSCDFNNSGWYRLCWHLGGSYGGYRIGDSVGLNGDTTNQRIVYQAAGVAPTTANSTAAPTGTKLAGSTLTAANTFNGSPTPVISNYVWQSSPDNSTWTNIGTNASTYTLTASEVGKYIRVQVTADNDQGPPATSTSSVTTIIGVPAPSTPDLAASSDSATNTDNKTSDTTPSISFTGVTTGATVTVTATKAATANKTCTTAASSDGTATCDLPALEDGDWSLTATQNLNSQTSSASSALAVNIDTVAPTLTLTAPTTPNKSTTLVYTLTSTEALAAAPATTAFSFFGNWHRPILSFCDRLWRPKNYRTFSTGQSSDRCGR